MKFFGLIYNVEGLVIPLMFCLNLSFILFIFGLVGIIWNKKSFLFMLVCIELMFFSLALNFIFISIFSHNLIGQTFSLLIISTAAAETAIGLSLLVISYRSLLKYKKLL